jgi:hypothetical protein
MKQTFMKKEYYYAFYQNVKLHSSTNLPAKGDEKTERDSRIEARLLTRSHRKGHGETRQDSARTGKA